MTDKEIHLGITDADIVESEEYDGLGPQYFASRRVVSRYIEHFHAEHFQPLIDDIVKEATDKIRDKLWDDVRNFLLSDVESNLQSSMRHQVDDTVKALMGGNKWALQRYALADKYLSGQEIREAVAKHIPKELQDSRVADLEEEVKRLKQQLEWSRR